MPNTFLYAGRPPQPTNVRAIAQTNSIAITWVQPDGALVASYEIAYLYVIRLCNSDEFLPQYRVLRRELISGSARGYTLSNSVESPVEEFSDYTIYLTAVSTSGYRSFQSTTTTNTLPSGIATYSKSSYRV